MSKHCETYDSLKQSAIDRVLEVEESKVITVESPVNRHEYTITPFEHIGFKGKREKSARINWKAWEIDSGDLIMDLVYTLYTADLLMICRIADELGKE